MDASPSLSFADLYARARAKVPVKVRLRAGVIARRSPRVTALLSVATFGVYGLVWLYRVSRELRDTTSHREMRPVRDVVLTMLTLGLYGIVAIRRQARTIHAVSRYFERSHADRSGEALVFALGGLLSLGVLAAGAIHVVQEQMNDLADLTDARERDRDRARARQSDRDSSSRSVGEPDSRPGTSSMALEAAREID